MKNLFRKLFSKRAKGAFLSLTHEQVKEFEQLQERISYRFKSPILLKEALTHSSYIRAKENNGNVVEFERMEFLGDAVLGLITVENLYSLFPNESEGYLSKLKSQIVSENYLALKAKQIELGDAIVLGDDEYKSKGYEKKSILADMMESLICAIYIDGGIQKARSFVKDFIIKDFEKEITADILTNFKSILQEYSQSKYQKVPQYRVVSTDGPDHKKTFSTVVSIEDEDVGHGSGATKKAAEQDAAKEACSKLNI